MADETHKRKSEENSTRLRVIVFALAVTYVLTFLSGFLQDTQYNFVNYIFCLCLTGDSTAAVLAGGAARWGSGPARA